MRAKDARQRAAEAKSAAEAAAAKANAAAARAEHPDIPLTDDEKAMAKQDNDTGVQQAQADIASCTVVGAQLADTREQMNKTAAEMTRLIPPRNIELMHKHIDEFQKIFGQGN